MTDIETEKNDNNRISTIDSNSNNNRNQYSLDSNINTEVDNYRDNSYHHYNYPFHRIRKIQESTDTLTADQQPFKKLAQHDLQSTSSPSQYKSNENMTVIPNMSIIPWSWKPEWSATMLSNSGLTATDQGQGKAWTTSVALTPIPPGTGYYYYEIKVDFCNISNNIKIVFGILSSLYLKNILSREMGKMGSLRGGCPFGYFPQFGKGTLCYFANGQIYKDGQEACRTEPFTKDDHIGMCVDTHTNSITFYKNQKMVGMTFHSVLAQLFDTNSENDQSIHQELYPAVSLIKDNVVSIVPNPVINNQNNIRSVNNLDITPQTQLPPPLPTAQPQIVLTTPPSPPITTTTTTTTTSSSSLENNTINNSSSSNITVSPLSNSESSIKAFSSMTLTPNQLQQNNTTTTTTSTSNIKPPPTPPLVSDPGNSCPICGISLKSVGKDWATVNKHIDECLTLSLLDNEQGNKPFEITCPYPGCKKPKQLSKDFVPHCNDSHFLENNHHLECPLCNTKVTNLISHLSKKHITLPVKKESFVGVGYSTSVLEHDLGEQECAICLEEFYGGQKVARLECWCIFHIDCISGYLLKAKKCPVHN